MDSPNNPVMSLEQIELFAELEEGALTRAHRRWFRSSLVGYLILLVGVVGMYENGQSVSANERGQIIQAGRAVAVSACNARFNDRREVRGVLIQAKLSIQRQYESGTITIDQRRQSLDFYDRRLEGLPMPDCRSADDALQQAAADNEAIMVPNARYVGDGVSDG